MKKWKIIFTPFAKCSDQILLLLSLCSFLFLNISCYLTNCKLDGILHFDACLNLKELLITNISVPALSILFFWILGKIIYSKTRVIDIVHTVLISLIPLTIVLLLNNIPIIKNATMTVLKFKGNSTEILNHFNELITLTIFSILTLPLIAYQIILLYNGFKTATNFKKWYFIVLFFVITFTWNTLSQFLF